jgi:CHAT domain-containing protein
LSFDAAAHHLQRVSLPATTRRLRLPTAREDAGLALPPAPLAAARTPATRSVASVYRGTALDLEELRRLPPLPATATELRALAGALGASATADVYLRERATETQIKTLDLSKKRVVAFATHGLMAGDLGLGEPGLAFTPPRVASNLDDGYLSASEAAALDLRAEWVILSACNTAAGDTPGAKGFSGLARAFFLAGAKSLLVSHWTVWDDVAERLTTSTVRAFQQSPAQGRAEALRQSMLAVMADERAPRFAHPAAWAPFVVTGETRAN